MAGPISRTSIPAKYAEFKISKQKQFIRDAAYAMAAGAAFSLVLRAWLGDLSLSGVLYTAALPSIITTGGLAYAGF